MKRIVLLRVTSCHLSEIRRTGSPVRHGFHRQGAATRRATIHSCRNRPHCGCVVSRCVPNSPLSQNELGETPRGVASLRRDGGVRQSDWYATKDQCFRTCGAPHVVASRQGGLCVGTDCCSTRSGASSGIGTCVNVQFIRIHISHLIFHYAWTGRTTVPDGFS